MTGDEAKDDIRIERKFNIGVIVGLILQAGAGIWYAAQLDSKVEALEKAQVALTGLLEKQNGALTDTISANRQFQIDQRLRVWDAVRQQGEELNTFKATMAGIDARLEYVARNIDRLVLLNDQRLEREREDIKRRP